MKRLLIGCSLLVVALTVCVYRLPASLIVAAVPHEAQRLVQLNQASGTLWRGNVQLSLIGVPPTLSIAWSCRPSLSPPGAHCQLADSVTGTLDLNLLSAALAGEQLALAAPVDVAPAAGISGSSTRISLTIQRVAFSPNALSLKASLRADDARYRIGQSETALGEVTVDCTPNPDGTSSVCSVANRGSAARLDGRVSLTANKATGTFELTPASGPVQRVSF